MKTLSSIHSNSSIWLLFSSVFLYISIGCTGNKAHLSTDSKSQESSNVDFDLVDAQILAQGISDNGFLDSEHVSKLRDILSRIREKYPETINIHANEHFALKKIVIDVSKQNLDKLKNDPTWLALNDTYKLVPEEDYTEYLNKTVEIVLESSTQLDIPSVVRIYFSKIPFILASPDYIACCEGNDIVVLKKGNFYYFAFLDVENDTSGKEKHNSYYYIRYNHIDDSISMVGSYMYNSKPPDFHLWGIPRRYLTTPFKDYDDLIEKTHKGKWWINLHAVYILGILLISTNEAIPLFGEDDLTKFKSLLNEVKRRDRESILALAKTLRNPDKDVRVAARSYLVLATGNDFGFGEKSVHRWKKWLDSHKVISIERQDRKRWVEPFIARIYSKDMIQREMKFNLLHDLKIQECITTTRDSKNLANARLEFRIFPNGIITFSDVDESPVESTIIDCIKERLEELRSSPSVLFFGDVMNIVITYNL